MVNPMFPHTLFAGSQNLDVSLHDGGRTSGRNMHLNLLSALKSRLQRRHDFHPLPPPPRVAPPSTESSSSEVPSSDEDDSPTPRDGVGARDIREGFVVGGGL